MTDKKWYQKIADGLHWIGFEAIKTLSNQPSFFASKRIERFVMFNIAMWTIVGFVSRKWDEMTVEQVSIITGILLAGGAWNAIQIRKDIKEIPQTPEKDDVTKEP